MSGAELALGIIPIVALAAQSYLKLHDRLSTLRNHHSVAKRLWIQFRCIQRRLCVTFHNFLSPVIQADDPWALIQSGTLTLEQRSAMARHIDENLGAESIDLCIEVFNEIRTIVEEVHQSLSGIENSTPVQAQYRSRALKQAANVSLQESRYKKQLEELRTWVGELSELLSAKHIFQPGPVQPRVSPDKSLPPSLQAINEASRQLGQGLRKSWTCRNTAHGSHKAAILFNAILDVTSAVHLDLAISCHQSPSYSWVVSRGKTQKASKKDIWLHVKSSQHDTDHEKMKEQRALASPFISTLVPETGSDSFNQTHGASSSRNLSLIQPHPAQRLIVSPTRRKLEGDSSVCCQLCNINFSKVLVQSKCCTSYIGTAKGYLGTSPDYEHIIFEQRKSEYNSKRGSAQSTVETPSVADFLTHLDVFQQLRTAHEVTLGFLKYGYTPWLRADWSLSDILSLSSTSIDLSTLHLSIDLPEKDNLTQAFSQLTNEPIENDRTTPSRSNAPILNLVYALLELAYRKPLKDFPQSGTYDDEAAAKRLINGIDTSFGKRYREIVRTCLDISPASESTGNQDNHLWVTLYNVALELESLAKDVKRIMDLNG